jgi:hypothetical protein
MDNENIPNTNNNFIPNLSVDCVIFGFDSQELKVLLKERKWITNEGKAIVDDHTLTGHHVLIGEDPDHAAKRVLKMVTGFDNIFLEQFHTFGSLNRLSREKDQLWSRHSGFNISNHVITVAYFALVDCNKFKPDEKHKDISWFPVNELPELGFDHKEILNHALNYLRFKIQFDPIGFELLPEKFTLSQLQKLYEAIFNVKFDRRNFRKKILQMKFIIPLDEKQKGVKHKPAQVFLFSREVYEKTKRDKLIFPI